MDGARNTHTDGLSRFQAEITDGNPPSAAASYTDPIVLGAPMKVLFYTDQQGDISSLPLLPPWPSSSPMTADIHF